MRSTWCSPLLLLAGCVVSHPIEPYVPPAPQEDAVSQVPASVSKFGLVELTWHQIGTSVEGRPIRTATVGTGPRKVIWIGGIHGNEREGAVATERLPTSFLATPGAAERVTLTILEDLNPDGSVHGTRGNVNRVDLNRNFPAENFAVGDKRFGAEPLSQPEARALHDLITAVQPDLVIVAHSWRGDHFINFDGPAEGLARLFSVMSGYPVRASSDLHATPGSLGSWVGRTLGVSILTLEYLRGADPEQVWMETQTAIVGVVLGV